MKLSIVNGLAVCFALSLPLTTVACASVDSESDSSSDDSSEATRRTAHFETFEGADGQTYFNFVAANSAVLLHSEGYSDADAAKTGVESVRASGLDESNYEIRQAKDGSSYVVLQAKNHEVIGVTEMYASKSNASRAVDTMVTTFTKLQNARIAAAARVERFETFTGTDEQSYFRLRAANGEIILSSEGYSSVSGAKAGIDAVKTYGTNAANYVLTAGEDGAYALKLTATNHETIGRGEVYASKYNAERARDRMVEIVSKLAGTRVAPPSGGATAN